MHSCVRIEDDGGYCKKMLGKGQNYEYHNVENQNDLQKLRRQSEHRKDLFKRSERRKSKRSERQKCLLS